MVADECKRKWKGLRDTFRKERKKERDRRRSGAEGGVVRQWRYAQLMAFVVPYMEDRKTSSNMEGEDSDEEVIQGQEEMQEQQQGQGSQQQQ